MTGTIERHGDHWDVRPTMADGKRGQRLCQLPEMSKARARDLARVLTERAAATGTVRDTPPVPPVAKCPPEASVRAWCDRWCEDRETRGLKSVDDDRGRLRKWILPKIGDLPVATFRQADLERFVEKLDEQVRADDLAWKTARNVWGLVTKACDDMVRSKTAALRVRKDNPATLVRGPDEGAQRSKSYLYPGEFLAVVSCERVPIRWRRLIALSVYAYPRAGELEALGLEDVILNARYLHVHRAIDRNDDGEKSTKTKRTRRVPIEPELLPLVDLLARERTCAPRLVTMPPLSDLSARLRQYLLWAGVTRAELHANDATRKPMTWHDLRATGITWRAIRGDEPMKIMYAAGHENMSTTMGYVREAEALGFLRSEVFPALPASLLLPGILPEGPAAWAKLRRIKAAKGVPSGIRKRSGATKSAGNTQIDGAARVEVDAMVGDKCPECGRRADLGQNDPSAADDFAALAGGLVLLGLGHAVRPMLATLGGAPARDPWAALEAAELAGMWPDDEGRAS